MKNNRTFASVLYKIAYQERQRDWPCEALATGFSVSFMTVLIPSQVIGVDESDAIVTNNFGLK
jgi:hypothetical protein